MSIARKPGLPFRGPRTDGVFLGVPYAYDIVTDQYLLVSGQRFDSHQFNEMEQHIAKMTGSKAHADVMRAMMDQMEKDANSLNSSTITAQEIQSSPITADKLIADMNAVMGAIQKPKFKPSDWKNLLDDPHNPFSGYGDDYMSQQADTERYSLSDIIQQENRKAQQEYDKKFQAEVLKLVTIAIEQGQANVTYMVPVPDIQHTVEGAAVTSMKYAPRVASVTYNPWMPTEMAAYRDVREQAENAVRSILKPPIFQKVL